MLFEIGLDGSEAERVSAVPVLGEKTQPEMDYSQGIRRTQVKITKKGRKNGFFFEACGNRR
jgi:hypothetical protein